MIKIFKVLMWIPFCAFPSAVLAEAVLDTYRYGGVHFLSWTSRSEYQGHQALFSIQNKERVRDLEYLVVFSGSGQDEGIIEEGAIRTLREDTHQILVSKTIPDNTEIKACATYYNISDAQHYASVSFYREPEIIGSGKDNYAAGPSLESAVPVRLRHDGSVTCRSLVLEGGLDAYPVAQRLQLKGAADSTQIETSDNPDNISLLTLTSWLVNKAEHNLEGLLNTREDIADIEYELRVSDPLPTPGPSEWSGQIPFLTAHTYIDFTISNPANNLGKRLPAAETTLDICLSYYQLSEGHYVREKWQAVADYKRVQMFKDSTMPQNFYPRGNIVMETSPGKLVCL